MPTATQTVVRAYGCPDARMTQRCSTIYNQFVADMPTFTSFDAMFDNAYKTVWLGDLTAAQLITNNETVQDQQRQLTEAVEAAMEGCRIKWAEVKYFAKKTFPQSKPIQDEFGFDSYRKVSRSAEKFLPFMELLFATATKYKTELIAAKYTQPQIDEIGTLKTALYNACNAQEAFINGVPVLTEERILTLNKPYNTLVQVCAAAQVIYADSAAKRGQYVFESGPSYDGPGVYEGTIAAGASVEVAHVRYKASRTLVFENPGVTTLQFFLNGGGLLPKGEVMEIIAGQDSGTLTMGELDATANHIIVKNTGPVAGNYSVTVGAV